MGQKLSAKEVELYSRVDEVLHYLWDPIGVAGAAGARDEYSSYVPGVFALLRDRAEPDEIVEHLLGLGKGMGIGIDPKNANEIAAILIEHRDWIDEMRDESGKSDPPSA